MSKPMLFLLLRICVCLAMMHWAHAPLWGAVILFVGLQINVGLQSLAGYLIVWTLMVDAAKDNEEEDEVE